MLVFRHFILNVFNIIHNTRGFELNNLMKGEQENIDKLVLGLFLVKVFNNLDIAHKKN